MQPISPIRTRDHHNTFSNPTDIGDSVAKNKAIQGVSSTEEKKKVSGKERQLSDMRKFRRKASIYQNRQDKTEKFKVKKKIKRLSTSPSRPNSQTSQSPNYRQFIKQKTMFSPLILSSRENQLIDEKRKSLRLIDNIMSTKMNKIVEKSKPEEIDSEESIVCMGE
jgi:hypothetical protein